MSDSTQDRIEALRKLAAETQQRVTAAGKRPHKRGRTAFKISKLVGVDRVELLWLTSLITLPAEADLDGEDFEKLLALKTGAAAAKSEEVAINLADLHWLLQWLAKPESPAGKLTHTDSGDTEPAASGDSLTADSN